MIENKPIATKHKRTNSHNHEISLNNYPSSVRASKDVPLTKKRTNSGFSLLHILKEGSKNSALKTQRNNLSSREEKSAIKLINTPEEKSQRNAFPQKKNNRDNHYSEREEIYSLNRHKSSTQLLKDLTSNIKLIDNLRVHY